MTRPEVLNRLFPDNAPLYFEGRLGDQLFIKNWTKLDRENDQGFVVHFFVEIDPKPVGLGGPPARERCGLQLDRELRPMGYFAESSGTSVALHVAGAKVQARMPDGTKLEVDLAGARAIVEANVTGLDALLFAIAHDRGELAAETHWTLFLLNQLMTIPYTVTPLGDRKYKTSYDEIIELDEHGVLKTSHVAKANVRFERLPAPPIPAWATEPDGTRVKEQVRYVMPLDAKFKLVNVSLATERGESGGCLTVPEGTGPFPAVVFLSGTGTHDRHGIAGTMDLGSHEIVDYLSNHGFVGLRYDTRGAGTTKAGQSALDSSLAPLVDDARLWIRYLAGRPEVDPKRISIIAHSQGGTIALLLATAEQVPMHAIALLATPGRTLHEILVEQIADQATRLGLSADQRDQQLREFAELIAAVKAGKSFEKGGVPDYLVPSARLVSWFKDHLEIDPVDLIRQLHVPLWIGQGAKDIQVSTHDAERLAGAAREAKLDVELAVFPDLDHLFKRIEGKSTLASYHETRHVDGAFLERLQQWLQR